MTHTEALVAGGLLTPLATGQPSAASAAASGLSSHSV